MVREGGEGGGSWHMLGDDDCKWEGEGGGVWRGGDLVFFWWKNSCSMEMRKIMMGVFPIVGVLNSFRLLVCAVFWRRGWVFTVPLS